MTNFIAQQEALADEAFEKFNFDSDISVSGFGQWDVSPNEGMDDYTRVVSVTHAGDDDGDDDGVDPREVSFHVKFKAGTLDLDDVYAYWVKNGGEILTAETEKASIL